MEAIGLWITALAGIAIAAVGALYVLNPRQVVGSFGLRTVPHEDATAWLRIKGVRDLTAGLVAGVLLVVAPPNVIGWVLLAFTLIPVGDAATVLASGGRASAAWGVHGATALVMLIGSIMLLASS